ncbi:MAG: hypothetical protein L3J65_07785 [Robiginitomaculum sp.]|nr:hypothetical protein [Robiginitomaculum sp.]
MNTHMRKLAIFVTTLVFAVTTFGTANAQFFDPDGGGLDTINTGAMTWEEWGDFCGWGWECNWAWDNPDVMEQMLASIANGYDTFLIVDSVDVEIALIDRITESCEIEAQICIQSYLPRAEICVSGPDCNGNGIPDGYEGGPIEEWVNPILLPIPRE